jgi:dihydrolipoamide dehydrogenase
LLQSSHKYHEAKEGLEVHGISVQKVALSLDKMMDRKNSLVKGLNKGIEGLFAKNKVTYIKGYASFKDKNTLNVELNEGGSSVIKAKNIIIATGSDIARIPGIEIDEKRVVSSTGALELSEVPSKMVVIGAGYIGLEMSSVWSRLGAEVTVVEYAPRVTPGMDHDISRELQKLLEKQGLKFNLETKVNTVKATAKGVDIEIEGKDGSKQKLTADVALISIGRRPYTEGLQLANAGLAVDERGMIPVDDNCKTSVDGIYAIGDVVRGAMLAHKAEEEGVAVAEILAGQHGHVNHATIPGIVYTYPEAASVGKTEAQLKEEGRKYTVGKFPLMANSRARANGELDGFVKILADAQTDEVLGAHIISASAGELIQEVVLGMEYKISSEDIARTCHGHPGLSEAVKEAAMACYDKPIHM